MKKIKTRPRLDKVDFEARATGFSFGRTVYLFMLFGLFAFLLNYFFGQTLFFRAHGLVMQEQHIVDAFYNSHLVDVYVEEGDSIDKDTPLVRINSGDVTAQIATLSSKHAEIATKLGGLKSREATLKLLIPLAQNEVNYALVEKDGLKELKNKQLINNQRVAQNMNRLLNAQTKLSSLEAEYEGLNLEVKLVSKAEKSVKSSLDDLKLNYDKGVIKSMVSGRVGPRVASQGDVKLAGEKIMTIYSGDPYIVTYMPHSYLFDIKEGMSVTLKSGNREMQGTISSLLPVADALPSEFQNLFKPTERTRLARIDIDGDMPFALLEKVYISGCDLFFCGTEDGQQWAMQAGLIKFKNHTVDSISEGYDIALNFLNLNSTIDTTGFASEKK